MINLSVIYLCSQVQQKSNFYELAIIMFLCENMFILVALI